MEKNVEKTQNSWDIEVPHIWDRGQFIMKPVVEIGEMEPNKSQEGNKIQERKLKNNKMVKENEPAKLEKLKMIILKRGHNERKNLQCFCTA